MSLDRPVIAPDLTYLGRAIKKGTRPVPSWTVYVHVISQRCTLERNEEWLRKMAEAEDGCNVNIGCAEQVMAEAIIQQLTAHNAKLQTAYDQLASGYEYNNHIRREYEKALENIIEWSPACFAAEMGPCFDCPTCVAREALRNGKP